MRALPRWLLLPVMALALSAASPVIFKRSEITLLPQTKEGEKPRQFTFTTQIRSAAALEQKDLFLVDPFTHAQALMFLYEPPALAAFRAPYITKKLDLVAVDANGTVREIVPQASPATLDPSQYAVEQPVRALLMLPAGTVDKNGIKPGDKIQHSLFTAKPEKRITIAPEKERSAE